ncbi:hypothetical protein J2Y63_002397 [Shinella sp. BE166]|uniref:hypothetical protein n=1 Tax=Shinella sp. BE166 TaxID=3373918 RepID=UPI003EB7F80A
MSEDEEGWSVEIVDGGFKWNQGVKSLDLEDQSVGTGIPYRVAVTEDGESFYRYLFHKGDLIFDNAVYARAPDSKCK